MLCAEVLLTVFFLYSILGATDARAPVGFAPIAIGLRLTLVHLISITSIDRRTEDISGEIRAEDVPPATGGAAC
ncbi:hypothetical protein [Knoellia sp. GCM10027209]|uniref:hypothetical protein n=1 Tax=Knoellia sp. GCM10027209 TaxID=3273396 RepID=UPI0036087A7F